MPATNVRVTVKSAASLSALVPSPLASLPPTPVRLRLAGRDVSLATGTGSDQVTTVVAASGTLAAGASVTVNLSDGTAKGIDGGATSLTVLRYLDVSLTTPGALVVGNGTHALAFSPSTATHRIEAGGPHFAAGNPAGWAVTGSAATVKLTNPGTAAVGWQLVAAGN